MSKYYAKELERDYFDFDVYFNEDDAINCNMWIGGNKNFIEMNTDLIEPVIAALSDIDYEVRDLMDQSEDTTEPHETQLRAIVENYLSKNSGSFTDDEIQEIIDNASKYACSSSTEETTIICNVLECIYNMPFKSGIFRGCCQGDWLDFICPEEVSRETLDYIEAVLFATGTEYQVTCGAIDSAADFDDADTYCDYTAKYYDEDVKKELADRIGCTPEEVVLLKITGTHHHTTHDYEEV